MALAAARLLRQAARLHCEDPRRDGSTVQIDSPGPVVLAGDMHGHAANMERVVAYAMADHPQGATLVLQELIHGPADPKTGKDRSFELLIRAAELKVENPEKVFILLGNHDVAQVTCNEITKAGRAVCQDFEHAVLDEFGEDGDDVLMAALCLLRSLPLAVRFPNRVMASHSMPAATRMDLAGCDILRRPYKPADFRRGGPVYEWTWGRSQTPQQIEQLAAELDVEFFLLAHRHSGQGWEMVSDRAISIDSGSSNGCVLSFDTHNPLGADNIDQALKRIARL